MIEPYIMFNGKASEAIEFYEKVFDGKNKRVMLWSEAPSTPGFPVDEMRKDWYDFRL